MSAVSAPKPDEVSEPASGSAGSGSGSDAEGWALLEGLRRRLDDQAAQGRKTSAQVGQLAESLAGLVEQQRRRSLWLNVNSFVAYLMFTILCGAGCYLLYRNRADELIAARDRAIGERDAAVRNADDATVRAVAREAAGNKAWEIYQLLEAGKRGEAVAKLDALHDQPLSKTERAVLAARVHETQVMEVEAALKGAVASFKAGRAGDVIQPLEAALIGEPPGARAATMHYYLGVAYARTDLDKAITHLQAAIAGDVDQEDARFQLASVFDRRALYPQARTEYDRFATAHPQSPLALFAMRRSATLARLPAAPPGGNPPPRAGGASSPIVPSPGGNPPPPAGAAARAMAPQAPAGNPAVAPGAPPNLPARPIVPAPPGVHAGAPVHPAAAAGAIPVAGGRAPVGHPWVRPAGKPIAPVSPAAPRPVPPPSEAGTPTAPANPPGASPAPPPADVAAPAANPPAPEP